jgi:hypothetical protein
MQEVTLDVSIRLDDVSLSNDHLILGASFPHDKLAIASAARARQRDKVHFIMFS